MPANRYYRHIIFGLIILCLQAGTALAYQHLLHTGLPFPPQLIAAPSDPDAATYLGITGKKQFSISQIKAELVLVEFFNTHCPHCQDQAPIYNKLYHHIAVSGYANRIKIIAFAVGNSKRELDTFRTRYRIDYPMLADPHFRLWKAIGANTSPFSVFVRIVPDTNNAIVVETHRGLNRNYQRIFRQMLEHLDKTPKYLATLLRDTVAAEPPPPEPFSPADLKEKVYTAFSRLGRVTSFRPVKVYSSDNVYRALIHRHKKATRMYAKVVMRANVCDLCHPVRFIYLFDKHGTIVDIIPLQLTKIDNRHWNSADIAKLKKNIVGSNLAQPPQFDAEVDAISGATISSAVIYNSIDDGRTLLKELRHKQRRHRRH